MRVLITGAVDGLGRALANRYLADGHHVTAIDIDRDGLHEMTQSHVGQCDGMLVDMADMGMLRLLVEGRDQSQFDVVILNAGVSAAGKFEEIPVSAYERLINVNLRAPLLLASGLVHNNRIAKGGKIVFISSLSHAVGYPGAAVYAATKDAIAVYAKSVRKPFKKRGVGILTVFPGPIRTAHAEKYSPAGSKADKRMLPEKLAKIIEKTIRTKKTELYPGFQAQMAKFGAGLAPNLLLRSMKKAIYDKLDEPKV